MITQFIAWIEQLSGHEAVVAGVGLGFFALQMLLSLRVYWRAASQERTLNDLHHELALGSDGRCEAVEVPRRFSWLRWVLSEFPSAADDGAAAARRFTRDEALHELDVRIASDPAYLMLQRMSIMAPLVGVVLTVLGFYWLDVDETGERSLQTIITAVTPLVTGVGTGAVLALINQFLLQLVGGRLERLRITARSWFDVAIWRNIIDHRVQAAANKAMVDHERIARSFASVARQFEQMVAAFQADMDGLPRALRGARDALEASAEMLKDLTPAATRSVSNLDVSVAAFRTTIDREFNEAARLHYRASKLLADAVTEVSDAAQSLKSVTTDSMHATHDVLPEANGEASLTDHTAPSGVRPR